MSECKYDRKLVEWMANAQHRKWAEEISKLIEEKVKQYPWFNIDTTPERMDELVAAGIAVKIGDTYFLEENENEDEALAARHADLKAHYCQLPTIEDEQKMRYEN